MTLDTQLRHDLAASVAAVEPSPDLLERARRGGARRLRRRRQTAAAAVALVVMAAGGVAVSGDQLSPPPEDRAAARPALDSDDPYAALMRGRTRGDLAHDDKYLAEVVAAWDASHSSSPNQRRGIFDDLRGKPKVFWAGWTPAGRAAVVVQQSYLRHHDSIQLDREGLFTLLGFVGEDSSGGARVIADSYPAPGSGVYLGVFTGVEPGVLILVEPDQPAGYSIGNIYHADGRNTRSYTPITFTDGVAVIRLPAGTDIAKVHVQAGNTEIGVFGVSPDRERPPRLWEQVAAWQLTPGPKQHQTALMDVFQTAMARVSDEREHATARSLWQAYGRTPDGTQVVVGEMCLDYDPTRGYAVLKRPNGQVQVVQGGVLDRKAALPVAIRLPDRQGWAAVSRGARLSYLTSKGRWSEPRPNAVLVPDVPGAKVKVRRGADERMVTLG